MALAYLMRLSLRKGAHAAASSAAWQEIRVRSGLGVTIQLTESSFRRDESACSPATAFDGSAALPFVIPSEAEGPAVQRTFLGNVFRERRAVEGRIFLPLGLAFHIRHHQVQQDNAHNREHVIGDLLPGP